MNRKEIVAVTIRLFSIGLIIYGIGNLSRIIIFYNQEGFQVVSYTFIGFSLFIFIVAALLWFFAYKTALIILPNNVPEADVNRLNEKSILSCGIILLGLYLFNYAVSDAIYWYYFSNYSLTFEGYPIELSVNDIAQIYSTVVRFIVSLLLILGSKGITNILFKLRYIGRIPSKRID